jgi:hypothetical protein
VSGVFKIRKSQMELLAQIAAKNLIQKCTDHILLNHSDEIVQVLGRRSTVGELDQGTLASLISSSLTCARSFGFETESSLLAFTVLRFVIAPNFYEHSAVSEILRTGALPMDARIDALWLQTTEADWEEIAVGYDPQAW